MKNFDVKKLIGLILLVIGLLGLFYLFGSNVYDSEITTTTFLINNWPAILGTCTCLAIGYFIAYEGK